MCPRERQVQAPRLNADKLGAAAIRSQPQSTHLSTAASSTNKPRSLGSYCSDCSPLRSIELVLRQRPRRFVSSPSLFLCLAIRNRTFHQPFPNRSPNRTP